MISQQIDSHESHDKNKFFFFISTVMTKIALIEATNTNISTTNDRAFL